MASYSVDIKLWGTVYITANSQAEAEAKLNETFGDHDTETELYISIDPQMIQEGVMLSPVATAIAPHPRGLGEEG